MKRGLFFSAEGCTFPSRQHRLIVESLGKKSRRNGAGDRSPRQAPRLNARAVQPARRLCVTIDAIEVFEGTDQAFGERGLAGTKPYARVVVFLVG